MPNSGSHLVTGGRIFTGAGWAESLLVEDGRVVAAGSERAVQRLRPVGAERTRLRGRLVLPGLIDPHLHLEGIALAALGVDLNGSTSVDDVVQRTAAWMERHPGVAVVGRGWDQERFETRQSPTRWNLDRLGSDEPVVLYRVCGHVAAVNSVALETAKIDRSIRDPPGGRIGRDTQGEPDGRLFDSALLGLARVGVAAFEEWGGRLPGLIRRLAAQGLTTIASMSASAMECRTVASLARERPLACRVRFYLRPSELSAVRHRPGRPESLEVGVSGIKLFADGSFGARTAWLSAPYSDSPNERGIAIAPRTEIAAAARAAKEAGLRIAVHAIGDRALAEVLRAYRDAPGLPPPRVEHAGLVPPALWPLLERVRPRLVVQPRFVSSDTWIVDRLGARRARWAYPFRTLVERGHRLAGSSDAPVEPTDPWTGLQAATRRRRRLGPHRPAAREEVSALEAIQWYTRNAGEAIGEPTLGHLRPGAQADLVIVDSPSLDEAIRRGAQGIFQTWRSGRVEYRRRARRQGRLQRRRGLAPGPGRSP